MISKEILRLTNILLAISDIFLYENSCHHDTCKFCYRLALILFSNSLETRTKNQVFNKLVVWEREIFLLFIASGALFQEELHLFLKVFIMFGNTF